MIEQFVTYRTLFNEIDEKASHLRLYIIGGAALLYRDIKPSTKDIDIVVRSGEEFSELSKILYDIGYEDTLCTPGHQRLNLVKRMRRDEIEIDVFLIEVCSRFSFSEAMVQRCERITSLDNLTVYAGSNEDIFTFKTITHRPGDLEDCLALAKRGLESDIILEEIQSQIQKGGKDIWIIWVNERLIELEERGVDVPIIEETNKLSEAYYASNL